MFATSLYGKTEISWFILTRAYIWSIWSFVPGCWKNSVNIGVLKSKSKQELNFLFEKINKKIGVSFTIIYLLITTINIVQKHTHQLKKCRWMLQIYG